MDLSTHADNVRRAFRIEAGQPVGPLLEQQPGELWGLPARPEVTEEDRKRIVGSFRDGRQLDAVDSALLWRILEINGNVPTIIPSVRQDRSTEKV